MTTAHRHRHRHRPDRLSAALAYADMVEAVENGYLETAISLSGEHAVPLEEVWSPEDDGIVDETASTPPSGKKPPPSARAPSTSRRTSSG